MIKVADIAVYDRAKNIKLIVEVKNRMGASASWASQMRENLLTHSVIPSAPYFLLVLPDNSYLWVDPDIRNGEALPSYTIETKVILSPYLQGAKFSLGELNEYSLALLVISWLQDVINTDLSTYQADPNLKWLFDSGLYEAIKGGVLATEAGE